MKAIEILDKYMKKLDEDNDDDIYSVLMFALQLPGICGRIEFSSSSEYLVDKNESLVSVLYTNDNKHKPIDSHMYKYWIKSRRCRFHFVVNDRFSIDDFADTLYDLRCNLIHEGVVKTSDVNVVLSSIKGTNSVGIRFGKTFVLSVFVLCKILFQEARLIFVKYNISFSDFHSSCLDTITYCSLENRVSELFIDFWKKYSSRDNLLVRIYEELLSKDVNLDMHIDEYFNKYPDSYYIVEDFGRNYVNFLKLEWSKHEDLFCEKNSGLLCKFTFHDFERMKFVYAELTEYSNFVSGIIFDEYHIGKLCDNSVNR